VDGFARRIETQPIDSLLNAKLDALLSLTEPELRTTAVKIVIAHALKPRAEQVAATLNGWNAHSGLTCNGWAVIIIRCVEGITHNLRRGLSFYLFWLTIE
jgi:hypothetical protein